MSRSAMVTFAVTFATGMLAAYELMAVSEEMKGLRSGVTHLERRLAALDGYVRSL